MDASVELVEGATRRRAPRGRRARPGSARDRRRARRRGGAARRAGRTTLARRRRASRSCAAVAGGARTAVPARRRRAGARGCSSARAASAPSSDLARGARGVGHRDRHRRAPPGRPRAGRPLLEVIRRLGPFVLPNTAGCYTARDAVRTAQLAREAFEHRLGEARGDRRRAHAPARRRASSSTPPSSSSTTGFIVLPYTTDDPILARRLEDVGCAAVMPLGSPIGCGLGIRNPHAIRLIVERCRRAGDPRRRDRHRLRRRPGDGARLRRGAAGERRLPRRGPGADGASRCATR